MAHATDIHHGHLGFVDTFANVRDLLKEKLAARAVYKSTIEELNMLNDRELADLGISRGSIRSLAYEAAYGK